MYFKSSISRFLGRSVISNKKIILKESLERCEVPKVSKYRDLILIQTMEQSLYIKVPVLFVCHISFVIQLNYKLLLVITLTLLSFWFFFFFLRVGVNNA